MEGNSQSLDLAWDTDWNWEDLSYPLTAVLMLSRVGGTRGSSRSLDLAWETDWSCEG